MRRDEGIPPYGCKGLGALLTLSAEILRCAQNDKGLSAVHICGASRATLPTGARV